MMQIVLNNSPAAGCNVIPLRPTNFDRFGNQQFQNTGEQIAISIGSDGSGIRHFYMRINGGLTYRVKAGESLSDICNSIIAAGADIDPSLTLSQQNYSIACANFLGRSEGLNLRPGCILKIPPIPALLLKAIASDNHMAELLSFRSPTFHAVRMEANNAPWRIPIRLGSGAAISKYDAETRTISIASDNQKSMRSSLHFDSAGRLTIEQQQRVDAALAEQCKFLPGAFAGEGYRASHHSAACLYAGRTPVSKRDFVNLQVAEEAKACLKQYMVDFELGCPPAAQLIFSLPRSQKSDPNGSSLLIDEEATLRTLRHHVLANNSEIYREAAYSSYVTTFDTNKSELREYFHRHSPRLPFAGQR